MLVQNTTKLLKEKTFTTTILNEDHIRVSQKLMSNIVMISLLDYTKGKTLRKTHQNFIDVYGDTFQYMFHLKTIDIDTLKLYVIHRKTFTRVIVFESCFKYRMEK